jgi:hypothetical protein
MDEADNEAGARLSPVDGSSKSFPLCELPLNVYVIDGFRPL